MTARCLLALLVVSLAVSAFGAEPPATAFETIQLKHLAACEVAPLLGPQFRFADALAGSAAAGRSVAREFPGVSLITAAHPRSRYLVAAGTAEGVGALRGFVATFDVPPRGVEIAVEVYPAPPAQMDGWIRLGDAGEVEVFGRTIAAGDALRFPVLPRDFKPTVIGISGRDGAAEFAPLPTFGNFPQALLALESDTRKGSVRVGVGVLDGMSGPSEVAAEAQRLPYTLRAGSGESVALMLMREKAAVTVVVGVQKQ
jgi:hypothetical protein